MYSNGPPINVNHSVLLYTIAFLSCPSTKELELVHMFSQLTSATTSNVFPKVVLNLWEVHLSDCGRQLPVLKGPFEKCPSIESNIVIGFGLHISDWACSGGGCMQSKRVTSGSFATLQGAKIWNTPLKPHRAGKMPSTGLACICVSATWYMMSIYYVSILLLLQETQDGSNNNPLK